MWQWPNDEWINNDVTCVSANVHIAFYGQLYIDSDFHNELI